MSEIPLTLAESKDLARTRDAQASPYRVSYTDPASYCADLAADFAADAIDDKIVRLAIVAAPATLQQVYGSIPVPGGNRPSIGFSTKYVSSSYFSRGRLVALSVYCGVSYVGSDSSPGKVALDLTKATALRLSETLNRVKESIKGCPGLEQRGGGVYIDDGADPWLAQYLTQIETPPMEHCATCGEEIYWSNQDWRHSSTKRAEVMVDIVKNGRTVKNVDHVADPLTVWRKS